MSIQSEHIILLGCILKDGKGCFVCDVSEGVTSKGLTAIDIIKHATGLCGGSGGGRLTRAEGGCKDGGMVGEAIEATKLYIIEKYGIRSKE
jgi:alanyl-tRNA synthetase